MNGTESVNRNRPGTCRCLTRDFCFQNFSPNCYYWHVQHIRSFTAISVYLWDSARAGSYRSSNVPRTVLVVLMKSCKLARENQRYHTMLWYWITWPLYSYVRILETMIKNWFSLENTVLFNSINTRGNKFFLKEHEWIPKTQTLACFLGEKTSHKNWEVQYPKRLWTYCVNKQQWNLLPITTTKESLC